MAGWPNDLSQEVRQLWLKWNGLLPMDSQGFSSVNRLLNDTAWRARSLVSRQGWLEIPDLVTQLCGFVLDKR